MRWSIRKNAADRPTVESLSRERADTLLEITALNDETQEIDVALPDLRAFDPTSAADAEDRKAAIAVEIANRKRRLAYINEGIAKLEAEAADKAADAQHAAAERQAKTDEKLVRGALSAIEKAVAEIEALAASVARTAGHNAQRGARAFITDAEKRVRQRPGRIIPAEYRDEIVWEDGAGKRPTIFREVNGEMVPQEAGFSKKTVQICVSHEREIAATMPDRLAELLPALKKALGK